MKKLTKPKAILKDDSRLQTRVLIEEIRSEVKIVGEQHGAIVRRLDNIDSQLNSVKTAVMEVDAKVNRVEKKLDTTISQNDERFKRIEAKLEIT